jgi:hypothetical protein
MQIIKDNYQELKRLKDEFELVKWLGQQGNSSAELWRYQNEIKNMVKEIMEGSDDQK